MILQIIISNEILDLVTGILAKISLVTGIWAKFRLGTGNWYPPLHDPLQTRQSQMLQRPIYFALSEIKGRRRQFEDLVILYQPKVKIAVLNYL